MRPLKHLALAAIAILSLAIVLKSSVLQVPTGTWKPAGNLSSPRADAVSVLVADGRVMIAGGTVADGQPSATVDVFNTDGSFSTVAPMTSPRAGHSAVETVFGEVVVTGGRSSGGGITNSAEAYDTFTDSWRVLPGTMMEARAGHTMSMLPDGNVLIAGGENSNGPVAALEVFDIVSETFKHAGALASPRKLHASAVLADGRVLIAGGTTVRPDGSVATLASTEIYDPATGSISAGPNMSVPRSGATATTLLNGNVLIAGGAYAEGAANGSAAELASAEIFDPVAGTFTLSASSLVTARTGHQAFLLPDNHSILIVGGTSAGADLASAELYIPWTDTFQKTGSMAAARSAAAGSPLNGYPVFTGPDGLLLIAGGKQAGAELYGFATVKTDHYEYSPGETVTINGAGWQPGETVTLVLHETPAVEPDITMTATADASGNFANQQFTPDALDWNVKFTLTATSASATAQAVFADAGNANDGDGTMGVTPTSVNSGAAATLTFTFTAPNGKQFNNGSQVQLTIPSAWPQPTASNIVLSNNDCVYLPAVGNPVISPSAGTVLVTMGCTEKQSFKITYTATAPAVAVNTDYTFTTSSKQADGSLRALTPANKLPVVTVTASSDTTPPDTQITANPANPTNSTSASFNFAGSANVAPAASLTFQCGLDGVAPSPCTSPASYTGLSSGSHAFAVSAKDAAGNVDPTPATFTWLVDTGAPSATITLNPGSPNGSNGWYTTNLHVMALASDGPGGSGVAETRCALDPAAVPTTFDDLPAACPFAGAGADVTSDGQHTVYAAGRDNAGNKGAVASSSFKIDKGAPVTTAAITAGTAGNAPWYTSDVTVRLTAADAGSTVKQIVYSISGNNTTVNAANADITISTEGTTTLSFHAVDDAGNTETPDQTFTVKIDKTKPAATCSGTDLLWHNVDVSLSCAAADGGSGLSDAADASFTLTTTVPADTETDNASTGSKQVCDLAGNCTDAGRYSGIKVDKKKPSFNCPEPDTAVWHDADLSVACTATDGGSGLSPASDGSFSLSTSVAADMETAAASTGSKQLCDAVGNCTTAGPYHDIKIDKKAPELGSCDSPDAAWHSSNVTLNCHYTDGGSGPANIDVPLTTNITAGTETNNASATATTKACDAVGNCAVAPPPISGNKIDMKPPATLLTATSGGAPYSGGWTNHNVSLSLNASDGGSDVKQVIYIINGGAPQTLANGGTVLLSADGEYTVVFYAVDNVDNQESAQTFNVKLDTTPPTIAFASRTPAANIHEWNNTDVTVTWTCTDSLSGAKDLTITKTVTGEGESLSAAATCYDIAGNHAEDIQSGIKIDRTKPMLTWGAKTPQATVYGWNNSDVSLPFTTNDNLSGVDTTSLSTPLTFTAEGENLTQTVTVTDLAGNSASFTSPAVNIDRTKPTLTWGAPAPAANADGWNNTNVDIPFTPADARSGIDPAATPTGPLSLSQEGAAVTGTVTVTDKAGNTETFTSPSVKIDKTPPVAKIAPDRDPDSNGWYNHTVSFDTAASQDSLSGLANCTAVASYSGGDSATASVSTTCTDKAGNAGTKLFSFKYDATPPALTCNAASFILHQPGTMVSAAVADNLSGAVSNPVSAAASTMNIGSFTVQVTGFDLAGNASSATCGYNVTYNKVAMLLQPWSPSVAYKAGSAIPLKWQYTDFNNVVVDSAGANPTISIYGYCTDATYDEVVLTVDDAGASGYRYDQPSMTWHFNWKTVKNKPGCFTLGIKSAQTAQVDGWWDTKVR